MQSYYFAFLFYVWITASICKALFGVDVSQPVSENAAACFQYNNVNAIVRIYESTGRIDPNAVSTIKNLMYAYKGLYLSGYIFPCYKCGNPTAQFQEAVQNLITNGIQLDAIWIDIEGAQYWSNSTSDNVNFIHQMVDEGKKQNYYMGIYTSASQWNLITGGSTAFKDLHLWYPHWDNVANFNDFQSFGGWTRPWLKQYVGDTTMCGVGVDKNFF